MCCAFPENDLVGCLIKDSRLVCCILWLFFRYKRLLVFFLHKGWVWLKRHVNCEQTWVNDECGLFSADDSTRFEEISKSVWEIKSEMGWNKSPKAFFCRWFIATAIKELNFDLCWNWKFKGFLLIDENIR